MVEAQPINARELVMDLIATANNPVPTGAISGFVKTPDGIRLRFARWDATAEPARGTVCVFPGRAEYIEKYFEVVADLRRRGFAVAVLDWRGQGGSDRLLDNPYKGHVRNFKEYDRDLATFMQEVVLPNCKPPYIALAHSMGGNILLRQAVVKNSWFSRMILTAPMIDISPEQHKGWRRGSVRAASELGGLLAWRRYASGGQDKPLDMGVFDGNELTSDPDRFHRNHLIVQAAPQLALGSATYGWLRAALRSIARETEPDYPRRVEVPLLIFAAGQDTIVSTTAIEAFAQKLKVGTHVLIPEARHEILQETDGVRQRFWTAFDAYMGIEKTPASA